MTVARTSSFASTLLDPVLRTGVRNLIRPVFNPRMPFSVQRRCLHQVTSTLPVPRSAVYRKRLIADRFAMLASPRRSGPGAILYLHGGGFVLGSPTTHQAMLGQLARLCQRLVLAPDYRLAPEAPYPAAQLDCLAAYRWLLTHGYSANTITLAGDSAGGGLALSTLLRIRAAGLPLPAGVVALSPFTDLTLTNLHATRRELMLRRSWLQACVDAYLSNSEHSDPLVSPVFAEYANLPPVLIQVGSDEILLNDARRLHQRILDTGGRSELQEFPAMWHVFQLHAGMLRSADQALAQLRDFILATDTPTIHTIDPTRKEYTS